MEPHSWEQGQACYCWLEGKDYYVIEFSCKAINFKDDI